MVRIMLACRKYSMDVRDEEMEVRHRGDEALREVGFELGLEGWTGIRLASGEARQGSLGASRGECRTFGKENEEQTQLMG